MSNKPMKAMLRFKNRPDDVATIADVNRVAKLKSGNVDEKYVDDKVKELVTKPELDQALRLKTKDYYTKEEVDELIRQNTMIQTLDGDQFSKSDLLRTRDLLYYLRKIGVLNGQLSDNSRYITVDDFQIALEELKQGVFNNGINVEDRYRVDEYNKHLIKQLHDIVDSHNNLVRKLANLGLTLDEVNKHLLYTHKKMSVKFEIIKGSNSDYSSIIEIDLRFTDNIYKKYTAKYARQNGDPTKGGIIILAPADKVRENNDSSVPSMPSGYVPETDEIYCEYSYPSKRAYAFGNTTYGVPTAFITNSTYYPRRDSYYGFLGPADNNMSDFQLDLFTERILYSVSFHNGEGVNRWNQSIKTSVSYDEKERYSITKTYENKDVVAGVPKEIIKIDYTQNPFVRKPLTLPDNIPDVNPVDETGS